MSETLSKRRILIIEANPVEHRLMASELQHGYDLDFAGDRKSALRCLQDQELLTLIDRIELADAERIRSVIELAQLRQIAVETVMEQLGIRRTTYV